MFKITLTFVLVSVFTGCASQAPTHYYRLQANTNVAGTSLQTLPVTTSLGVGPVRLPSMLDYKALVSEQEDTGVKIASHDLWAGDLDKEFTRVVTELMAARVSGLDVVAEPWDTRFRPEYQLRLDVQRFSGALGGKAVLKANAILLGDFGKTKLGVYTVDLMSDAGVGGYNAYVISLNSLLEAFADQSVAVLLQHISQQRDANDQDDVLNLKVE